MTILEKIKYLTGIDSQAIEKDLTTYYHIVDKINEEHQTLKGYSDAKLQELANKIHHQVQENTSLDDLLIPAFALVKEVCTRQLGMTPYDVQLIGGIAMHNGRIIEMQTGEGKTLAAVLPVYLNALSGKGVHILTFNDYLAKRDALWMKKVYEFLGLSVGYIQEEMSQEEKRTAYQADITYATAKEIGFDYLREFMAFEKSALMLRPFNFAIVDEADALMIDEARNPLVLAGKLDAPNIDYYQIAEVIRPLEKQEHYELDDAGLNAYLTEKGINELEQKLNISDLYALRDNALQSAINLALHAKVFLKKDIDFVILDEKIKLVDEFTGRIVEDRKWRNGLQTAVEAKEGLTLQSEGSILNAISLQHFLRKYPKLAGMTATAQSSAEEFFDFYELEVTVIPSNKPCLRIDHDDVVYTTKAAKKEAIVKEVQRVHAKGQPILIGTLTVKESEALAELLRDNGIKGNVLNAKNNEKEAQIIADAGKIKAVTISTNMAGRGTDIKLGGANENEREAVIALGGLYVLGTNRHESKRIDQQLKGRAGRQGDIGESRFVISFEDDLMKRYDFKNILPKKYHQQDGNAPIIHRKVLKHIDITQHIIENRFMDMRRNLMEYAYVMELQRNHFQTERQEVLVNNDFFEKLLLDMSPSFRTEQMDEKLYIKSKEVVLFLYDRHWSELLDFLTQLRENIHFVRLGGQTPLREFRKRADELFQETITLLYQDIETTIKQLLASPSLTLEELGVKRPSSTWTYVISDNPYSNQLAVMLMNNGNIGFMVDPISVLLLFFKAIWERVSKR